MATSTSGIGWGAATAAWGGWGLKFTSWSRKRADTGSTPPCCHDGDGGNRAGWRPGVEPRGGRSRRERSGRRSSP